VSNCSFVATVSLLNAVTFAHPVSGAPVSCFYCASGGSIGWRDLHQWCRGAIELVSRTLFNVWWPICCRIYLGCVQLLLRRLCNVHASRDAVGDALSCANTVSHCIAYNDTERQSARYGDAVDFEDSEHHAKCQPKQELNAEYYLICYTDYEPLFYAISDTEP